MKKQKSTEIKQAPKIDWAERRRRGIGGSDVASILGFSPFRSAMDIWMDKKGFADKLPRDRNREFLLTLGKDLEPVIANCYERETRRVLVPGGFPWEHKKYPCLLASPDRFVEDQSRGVELKSENLFQDNFGDPGSADVPVHYALQCAHYMAVCNVDCWDVAVLHGGARFAVYTLVRDKELEEMMIERLLTWWERHILGDTPPDVDSSEAWKVYVKRKFPEDLKPMATADVAADELLKQLAWLRTGRAALEEMLGEIETRVKYRIGDHTGLKGHWGTATWKKTKDIHRVNWQAALIQLAPLVPHETMAKILQDVTTVEPGIRRLLFKEREDDGASNSTRESFKRILGEVGIGAGHLHGAGAGGSASESPLPVRGAAPEGPGPGTPETAEGVPEASVCGSGALPETDR
ncbi:MAG TPA: YqaJ viral recombinase family protein [Candidatus Acidoferrum sp.]